MGFLKSLVDLITGGSKCPACGSSGARKTGYQMRCPNPSCQYFDPTLQQPGSVGSGPEDQSWSAPAGAPPDYSKWLKNDFKPEQPLEVQYVNFQNISKTFTIDAATLRVKGQHISARAVPTGQYIALSRKRIQNLAEIEAAIPERVPASAPYPSARERQVLGYHKKHGTTSPLYEKIRARYPKW